MALVGNPNVGKSTLFNQVTGSDVSTAHYPGTTREATSGATKVGSRTARIVDLPGSYSLFGVDESASAARAALFEERPSAVIAVVDETNLSRNLYLVLQLLDLGVPTVVALNLHDEAARTGISTDVAALVEALRVPVVPMVAQHGIGVAEAVELALGVAESAEAPAPPGYSQSFEALLEPVIESCRAVEDRPFGLTPRGLALLLLEGDLEIEAALGRSPAGAAAAGVARRVRDGLSGLEGGAIAIAARERYAEAGVIAERVQGRREPRRPHEDAWSLATSRVGGVAILVTVLATVFGLLFVVGERLAAGFSVIWSVVVGAPAASAIGRYLGDGVAAHAATWAVAGVEASLAIGIPYILTFYVLLAVLEDSGYLNAVAFLMDRTMHRFGLHGLAIVPLVAAAGCNVPAVLAATSLPTKRERTIASALVVLVPCSARTAVVLGSVGAYVGALPAVTVLAVNLMLIVGAGLLLHRMMPGGSTGLVMEVFSFRRPRLKGVLRKAWVQFREFLFIALPVVVAGSVVLGVLYEGGLLWRLTGVLDPVITGWLMLPSVTGLTLVLGLLRKELALQLLMTLAVIVYGAAVTEVTTFMSSTQVFVYALVNTVAIPCVSTLAVLGRRLGWWQAAAIAAATVLLALGLGGAFARVLPAIGWT